MRHTHIHTHTHTHTHTHRQIARDTHTNTTIALGEMQCVAFHLKTRVRDWYSPSNGITMFFVFSDLDINDQGQTFETLIYRKW